MGFGPHLVFDGFGCPRERLEDLTALYRLLDGLPDRIRMTKIMPPYVFRHGLPEDPAGGLSGFVLIAESHISLHTFPGRGYVNADVFSCETFLVASFKGWIYCRDNAQKCVDIVLKNGSKLGASHQAWQMNEINALIWPSFTGIGLLDRGREFPKHIAASRAIVNGDRRQVKLRLGLEASR